MQGDEECRLAFGTMVSDGAGLPAGERIVFGYNFGKLSNGGFQRMMIVKPAKRARLPSNRWLITLPINRQVDAPNV